MPPLDELLEEAAGDIQPGFSFSQLQQRVAQRRRQRRTRTTVIAGLLVAGTVAGLLAVIAGGDPSPRVSTQTPIQRLFGHSTGSVLVLWDGYDGATLVDLDHRVAVRRVLPGARAGDQPYPLTQAGGSLVVGWGEISAVPLDGSPPRDLGRARFYVPAAEPGAVWLIDYPTSSTTSGTPMVREVDITGRVLRQGYGFDPSVVLGTPDIGLPDGLAYEMRDVGLVAWDPTLRAILWQIAAQPATAVAVHGAFVAWSPPASDSIHITGVPSRNAAQTAAAPSMAVNAAPGEHFEPRTAQFSPNGRYMAVVSQATGQGRIRLIDTAYGTSSVIATDLPPRLSLAWSTDGKELFFTSNSYQKSRTTIGDYRLTDHHLQVTSLPFGGLLSGAVERNQTPALLSSPLTSRRKCPAPAVYPSRRTAPCSFRF